MWTDIIYFDFKITLFEPVYKKLIINSSCHSSHIKSKFRALAFFNLRQHLYNINSSALILYNLQHQKES